MKLYIRIILAMFIMLAAFTGLQAQQKSDGTIVIKTSAVCGQCKTRIEEGMAFEKGVKDVTLDVESKNVTITFNPKKTSPEALKKAISKLGYDADEVPADLAAYNKLPSCCKKDAPKH